MLKQPWSMHPLNIFGYKIVGTITKCCGCNLEFETQYGVVFFADFISVETNEPCHGPLMFCDTKCILENYGARGVA